MSYEVEQLPQAHNPANSTVRTAAHGASEFVGEWTMTRAAGFLREITVVASNVASGLGGTFTFEFSEDGLTASISETRVIEDFSTVRDFDLMNFGAYYRVKFLPSRALVGAEAIYISTQLMHSYSGSFVRLANQQIEESNAAMGQAFAYLKAFDPITGKSVNVRPTPQGALRVALEAATLTQSGSLFTEGIRDDIDLIFSRDQGVETLTHLVDAGSINGTVTHDATQGQAVFAVPATAGSVCYFHSDKVAVYEPGHQIRGGQTIEISAQPTGTGKIEWGWGEDDGASGLLNAIGFGYDASGFYVFRVKNGSVVAKTYQEDFNRDRLNGSSGSRYLLAGSPVAINLLNNSIFESGFEWYGIAPPTFFTTTPGGLPIQFHVEETTGQQTGTTIPEPGVPLFIRIENDATTPQALTVRSGSWRGGVFTNKVATLGRQPDRDYTASKADGEVFHNSTPLLAAGEFLSDWHDSDGWTTLEIFVSADQVSAASGLQIEYSDDVQVAVPVVRGVEKFTFGTGDAARGFTIVRRGTALDGFRVRYTNGGFNQGAFFISATLRVPPSGPPLNSLESGIDSTSVAQMTRSAIFAKDGGTYELIGCGTNRGLDTGIVEHEVPTPIKSDTAFESHAATVTSTASKIIDYTAIPANATSVEVQAAGGNNSPIYFGESSAKTLVTTAGFELDGGQSKYISIGEGLTTDLWAAAGSGTQRYRLFWTIGGGV